MAIARARLQQGYQMVVANRGEEKGEGASPESNSGAGHSGTRNEFESQPLACAARQNGEQIAYLLTKEQQPQKVTGKKYIAAAIANVLETVKIAKNS